MDGWLLRFSPGKAKRARCIHALAPVRRPLDDQLAACAQRYAEHGLPPVLRVTPFTEPPDLDTALHTRGWHRFDDTRVMVLPRLDALDDGPEVPSPHTLMPHWPPPATVPASVYAEAVGRVRGSPAPQIEAHAERLRHAPVPYRGVLWTRADGAVAAGGQWAREADAVGLYDVFVHPDWRGRGLARTLCHHLLLQARADGARWAYLQVEADNRPARAVYHRLGFVDGYGYHYRSPVNDENNR